MDGVAESVRARMLETAKRDLKMVLEGRHWRYFEDWTEHSQDRAMWQAVQEVLQAQEVTAAEQRVRYYGGDPADIDAPTERITVVGKAKSTITRAVVKSVKPVTLNNGTERVRISAGVA